MQYFKRTEEVATSVETTYAASNSKGTTLIRINNRVPGQFSIHHGHNVKPGSNYEAISNDEFYEVFFQFITSIERVHNDDFYLIQQRYLKQLATHKQHPDDKPVTNLFAINYCNQLNFALKYRVLRELVKRVRQLQRTYFSDRTQAALVAAKSAESDLDQLLKG